MGRDLLTSLCHRSFFPGADGLLASTAKDRQLIVWRVNPGDEGADALTGQQVLALQLPRDADGRLQLVGGNTGNFSVHEHLLVEFTYQ